MIVPDPFFMACHDSDLREQWGGTSELCERASVAYCQPDADAMPRAERVGLFLTLILRLALTATLGSSGVVRASLASELPLRTVSLMRMPCRERSERDCS